MASPKPFKISVPQEKTDVLKQKLSLVQFPDELEASAWDLGSPLNDIKRLTKAWEQFDWRQAENKIESSPSIHHRYRRGRLWDFEYPFRASDEQSQRSGSAALCAWL